MGRKQWVLDEIFHVSKENFFLLQSIRIAGTLILVIIERTAHDTKNISDKWCPYNMHYIHEIVTAIKNFFDYIIGSSIQYVESMWSAEKKKTDSSKYVVNDYLCEFRCCNVNT